MIDFNKICVLETMDSFKTLDFSNNFISNQKIMSESLKHKGFEIPNPKRGFGGAKIRQEFYYKKKLAVSIDYVDVIEAKAIVKIKKVCKYYNTDGTVFCQKTEFELVKNEDKLKRSRYDSAYTFLKETAKGTPIETYVNAILSHYSNEVTIWLLGDFEPFKNAIKNEKNKTIVNYLLIKVDAKGKTVKDSILNQLL